MLRNLVLAAKSSLIYRRFLGRWVNQRQIKDPSRLVNSLYKAAFGCGADPSQLANCMRQLESGVYLETVAAQLVDSADFRARHGSSSEIDIAYLRSLYR